MTNEPRWRRFAYVSVADANCRRSIVQTLIERGWCVETRSTVFHVLDDLCDVIIGKADRVGPGLIAMDLHARGCSGISVARGLRDLGVDIPVVLVAEHPQAEADDALLVVSKTEAAKTIARLLTRPRAGI
jgi:FixJ family two-component response regulator